MPISSRDFQIGLHERFVERDGMYFTALQAAEYEHKKITTPEFVPMGIMVSDEVNGIEWIKNQLRQKPQTYQDIYPNFIKVLNGIRKGDQIPGLDVLLEENFLQDEKSGRWYIPDVTKEGDIAKLREKKLWKEFEGYMNSKGKLKLFRSEAIRVGFSRLWKEKNYQAIVNMAERLPEQTIQEDPNLLMYYDISLGRV